MNTILQVTWDVSPEMFSVGSLTLRYYGFLFVTGFIIGYFILKRHFRIEGVSPDEVDNLTMFSFVVAVLAARFGHVFFYEPAYYLANPSKILRVWEGGVASHGAVIGLLIFLWFYARKKRWKFLWILDRLTIPGALTAALVRIGNLMNSEIYGHLTDVSWGFRFVRSSDYVSMAETMFQKPIAEIPAASLPGMHPTQIYEAIAYVLVFAVLLMIYKRKKKETPAGLLTSWFLIMLFGFRFLIEFMKEVQVSFEQDMLINMGQILSIPFVLTGIILLLNMKKLNRPVVKGKK